jgi:hypothetical protein
MGTKFREVIWGGRVGAAKANAEHARERAKEAVGAADRAELTRGRCESKALAGRHSHRRPSRNPQWRLRLVTVKCRRCETEASIPLEYVRRPPQTLIWKLEAALKCRACRTSRYSPPVHMIKLTEAREIVPYVWVHPADQR